MFIFRTCDYDSRCTHTFGTPSLYLDLITTAQALDFKITTLQVAISGGAPCSQQLALQIRKALNVKRLVVSSATHHTNKKRQGTYRNM
jgi:phenylacetate-coenzyme A ligase PaaK-like adenylate-forming protein